MEEEMKRTTWGVLMAAVVLTAGVALAGDGPGTGYGPGRSGASAASVKKFQKETLSLRDDLGAKQADLQEEYDKPEPDAARIASLRKDIVDIEARIQIAADKYAVRSWGRGYGRGMGYGYGRGPMHGYDRSMMHGWDGPGYQGYGCGCW